MACSKHYCKHARGSACRINCLWHPADKIASTQALAGLADPAGAKSASTRKSAARIFACLTRHGQLDSVAGSLLGAVGRSEHLAEAAGAMAVEAAGVYGDPCLVRPCQAQQTGYALSACGGAGVQRLSCGVKAGHLSWLTHDSWAVMCMAGARSHHMQAVHSSSAAWVGRPYTWHVKVITQSLLRSAACLLYYTPVPELRLATLLL